MSSMLVPQCSEIEKSVLGKLMFPEDGHDFSMLKPDHFYIRSHKIIFQTIRMMQSNEEVIDTTTVSAKLNESGILEEVGGWSFISSCISLRDGCHPEKYFPILEEKMRLRKLLDISENLKNDSYLNNDSNEIIEKLGNEIIGFQRDDSSGNLLQETIREVNQIIQRKLNGEKITGLQTSIFPWDNILGGLSPRFYVLAARGGRGKTAMMEQMVDALLLKENPVLVFQKDMSLNMFILRIACRRCSIAFTRFDLGYCNPFELKEIQRHVDMLGKSPLYLYCPTGFTATKFCSIVKIEQRIHGIKAVFLDHILNLDVGQDYRTGLTLSSTKIRESVQSSKIPHVILAQLNRGAHNTERPTAAHIKEFDALYADCDAMVMLWSEKEVHDVPRDELFPMKFTVNKNRYGTEFEEDIGFDRPLMKFKPIKI